MMNGSRKRLRILAHRYKVVDCWSELAANGPVQKLRI